MVSYLQCLQRPASQHICSPCHLQCRGGTRRSFCRCDCECDCMQTPASAMLYQSLMCLLCLLQCIKAHNQCWHIPNDSAWPCPLQSGGTQSEPWRSTSGSTACPTALSAADLICSLLCVLQSVRARYQLPLGAVIHPLADPQDVPVVNLGSAGIVRCRMCRTYINPFVQWIDSGRCGTRKDFLLCPKAEGLPQCLLTSSVPMPSGSVQGVGASSLQLSSATGCRNP